MIALLLGAVPFVIENFGFEDDLRWKIVAAARIPYFIALSFSLVGGLSGIGTGIFALVRRAEGTNPNPARLGIAGGLLLLPPVLVLALIGGALMFLASAMTNVKG